MLGAGAGSAWGQTCCTANWSSNRAKIRAVTTGFSPPWRGYMARTRRCSIGLRHFHVAGQKHRALFWVGLGALVVAVVAVATFEILLSRAEPILRARLLQSLSARFH